ncbi:ABC transporter permease subunit [Haloferula sp. A504]|uniref:ABC transporter permease subunit n=1 Tax=Haloferula sp. A504 TaxID=3373601 RepID=UPI0031C528E9|nr:ABC transporter permease subunit [Verrucomicrobiaceae bacterium E54]
MKAYFIRRLLLIPLTLIGITLLVFVIVRVTPGGPVEQGLQRLMGGDGESRVGAEEAAASLSAAQVLELEEEYDQHKGILRGYLEWLGVLPRDIELQGREFPEGEDAVEIPVPGTVHVAKVTKSPGGDVLLSGPEGADLGDWQVRVVSPETQARRFEKYAKGIDLPTLPQPRAVIFKPAFDGLLQGSLGYSWKYQDPVWRMILQRMPVSLFFGGIAMVLIYSICLPLGIIKAIKHRSWMDNFTSVLVFAGYAIPGYALGALLVVYFGAQLRWFALGGFVSDNFDALSLGGKIADLAYHGTLPLLCYIIGSFAMMTMLMKNNLMDNLAADYVRTAIAKGTGFPKAVFQHAFRNSIIPIATTFGGNLTLIVAGSVLIERVFDINGFGLLSFNAILEFDQPVIMGVLFVSALLMLLGNVISDLCVALVDPRVSYK